MDEAAFKEKLRKKNLLKLPEKTWYFAPVQTGMGSHGIPDILMCVPVVIRPEHVGETLGLFVAVEAKIHPNKTTPLQDMQLEGIAQAGGQAMVVTAYKDPKKPVIIKEVTIK